MYNKNDKRRLYELMDLFIKKEIVASFFCDEFYYSFDLEIDSDALTQKEEKAFSDLSKISSRFSQFKEDHEKYPEVFYGEDQLIQKVIETRAILDDLSLI
jgi:hypothetical protein